MLQITRCSRVLLLIFTLLLLAVLPACSAVGEFLPEPPEEQGGAAPAEEEDGLPPGSNLPGGDSAMPEDVMPAGGKAETGRIHGSDQPLKPVRFRNLGSTAYTVSPWSYVPLDPNASAARSEASTVVFPGGSNPSASLDLPLGTYTWCYHWELGDTDGDGMIDYAHALDGRPVMLDQNDSDDSDLAETVDLSAPTLAGEMPGRCGEAADQAASLPPRPPRPNGELLFSDSGGSAAAMFPAEYMSFGYQGGLATLTANAANFVLPAMYSGAGSFGDLTLEVDFMSLNAGTGGQYSVIFRSDDVDGGLASYYIVSLFPYSRTIELAAWQEGWQGRTVATIEDASISMATPLHFRLEVVGSEITAYINGAFAAGFADSQIGNAGIIGMSITSESVPGSYAYQNLRVYGVP